MSEAYVGQLDKSGQLKLSDAYAKQVNESELKVTLVSTSLDNLVAPPSSITKLTLIISSIQDAHVKLELRAIAETEMTAYFEAQAACLN